MSHTTRFLTGSLASLAVASGVGLTAPAAFADATPVRPCGQPAVAAIFATVVHEPELRHVPAVTHDEWRWERQVTTYLHQYSTILTPAYTVTDWARTLPVLVEFQWSHKVITQEARPAVPGTAEVGHWEDVPVGEQPTGTGLLFEYQQKDHVNQTRWERDGWNGEKGDGDRGLGWVKTGRVQQWVVTEAATDGSPAVPEISELVTQWSATSPGADWSRTGVEPRTSGGGTQTTTTTGDDSPGEEWTRTSTRTVAAVVDTRWAYEAPDGYTATDADPQEEISTESTEGTSATAPGDGWSKVAESRITIIDQDATTQLVGGGTEQVEVVPALPATDACVAAPTNGNEVAGPKVSGPKVSGSAAHATVAAPAESPSTVLPATGSPVSPLLLTTGLGALLAGGALVRVGRRRQTS